MVAAGPERPLLFYVPATSHDWHPPQHLMLSLLVMLAILIGVQWQLIVSFICIFLMDFDRLQHFFFFLVPGIKPRDT